MSRPIAVYVRNLHQAHKYAWWFIRVFVLFKEPLQFLSHYLRRTSPPSRQVAFRDGTVCHLSGYPHDLITLFVIFVRRDYGFIPAGTTVVDVGANTGVFSLFAAKSGARRVLAYEPNGEALQCLTRNAQGNAFGGTIFPQHLAVGETADQQVRFPTRASVYNRVASSDEQGDFELVPTIDLRGILERHAPEGIDLLKLDCEGAEYGILGAASREDLRRVREIRMEYHEGRVAELKQRLQDAGFRIELHRADNDVVGNIWARRV